MIQGGKELQGGHVSLAPGAAFGGDLCVRFHFATSEEHLEQGLAQLQHS